MTTSMPCAEADDFRNFLAPLRGIGGVHAPVFPALR